MQKYILRQFLNQHFLLLLLANIIIFILCSIILPLRFEDNDDIVMLLFASGKYTGTPEPNLVFINYIYGFFVSFLYTITGKIEWYTILFAIIHIFSLTVIVWFIVTKDLKTIYKILFAVVFYVIEIRILVLFQFTTTAALGSLAGIVLILKESHEKKVAGLLLLIIASLIRIDASFLVLLVVSPVFIPAFFKQKKLKINQTGFYLLIAVTSMLFCKYIDYRIINKNVEWANYNEYNKLRGEINDNPNASKLLDHLPPGINNSDYRLLLNFIPDSKIIDLKIIRLIHIRIKNVDFYQKIKNIYPSLRAYTIILFIIINLWLFVLSGTKEQKNKIQLILSFLIFAFVFSYISLEGTFKDRVFITALLPFIFVIFSCFEIPRSKILKDATYVVLISFIIVFSYRTYKICNVKDKWDKTAFAEQKNLLDNYLKTKKNSVLPYQSDLSLEFFPAFNVSRSFNTCQIIFSGWTTNIPYNKNLYNSHMDSINNHALFVRKESMEDVEGLIINCIKKNYNIDVKMKIVAQSTDYAILEFYNKY